MGVPRSLDKMGDTARSGSATMDARIDCVNQ